MADWVHCNSCYVRPGGGKLFSLTNCGHIYCADCLQANPDQCTICRRACNSIVLSSQMKPEVEMYFTNPIDLSKKYYTQLSQVLEFQKSHRERLAANIEKKVLAAERLQRHMSRLQELEREVAVLQEENVHLKRLLANNSSRPGTPHSYRNSPGTTPRRGHTPSPTCSQYSSSPYGRTTPNSSQKENKGSHHWQNQLSRPASGPTRLSVRTPPCNGFMGTVRGTPSPNKQVLSRPGSAGGTPGTVLRNNLQGRHLIRTANTPGSYEAATPSGLGATGVTCSPMAMSSPILTTRSTTTSNNRISNRSQYTTPSSSQASSQSNISTQLPERCSPEEDEISTPPSQLDPSRRQIQLRYQPRSAIINKQPFLEFNLQDYVILDKK